MTTHTSPTDTAAHATHTPALRQDIQQLRGIAVLAVIINHLGIAWLPGGYLGVDIFFVVSGFVITLSMLSGQTSATSRAGFFVQFWIRRMFRLWPMLFTTVVITCLLLVITRRGLPGPVLTGLSSLFAVSNIRLLIGRLEYFSIDTSTDWFMHTWSLAVEEQIYVLLSFVFAMFGIRRASAAAPERVRALALAVLVLVIVSLVFVFMPFTSEVVRFYAPHTRFYQVGAGALIALWFAQRGGSQPLTVPIGASDSIRNLLLAASAVGIFMLFVVNPWSGRVISLVTTALTALIIAAASARHHIAGFTPVDRGVGRWLSGVGNRSYSLYLVHWPIQLAWTEVTTNRFWAGCGSVLSALVLGSLGYRTVEIPTRDVWRRLGIKKATFVSVAIFLVTVLLVLTMFVVVERNTRPPALAKSDRTCTDDSADVWVIGDSHFTLSPQQNLVAELVDGDCRFLGGYGIVLDYSDLAKDALGQRSVRIKLMSPDSLTHQITESDSPPKVLLIVHFLTAFLSDPLAAPPSADFVAVEWEDASGSPVTRQQFIELLEKNLIGYAKALAKTGSSLIVTSPPPDFDWIRYPVVNNQCGNPAGRLCTKYRTEATLSRSQHEVRGGEIRRLLDSIAMTLPNFYHLQLDSPFCNQSRCSNFGKGGPLYMDDDHLNMAGVSVLEPLYSEILQAALNSGTEPSG